MLDFAAFKAKAISFDELTAGLTLVDLANLTNEMVDTYLRRIHDCTDEDVDFQPQDPEAYDSFAANASEVEMAWTLAHVIVHASASAEEAAAMAAEMARGVEPHGRSRYEVPWRTITTIAQCRARLEESRRMRLASLGMWPETPHMETVFQFAPDRPRNTCIQRFVHGLRHEYDHLGQLTDIVSQAREAQGKRREPQP